MKYKILLCLLGFLLASSSSAQDNPFTKEVNQFARLDSLQSPVLNEILFIGSSSFTLWKTVQDAFPDVHITNRAFGGSRLSDVLYFYPLVVAPYQPRQVVLYCGENDFAWDENLSAQELSNRFEKLFEQIRTQYPDCRISYVSMKPSPSRWHLETKFQEANHLIKIFLSTKPKTDFIDVWDLMLNKNNKPEPSIFLSDSLHMNDKGYQIWKNKINPYLTH